MNPFFTTPARNPLYRLAALLVILIPATALADELDPTTPSLELRDLMPPKSVEGLRDAPPAQLEKRFSNSFQPHLQGLVFSDRDNGTALITFGETESRFVTLRREKIGDPDCRFSFGEIVLEVTDFSDTSVVLQSMDGSRRYILN